MDNARLKHFADTFEKQARENEEAAAAFLQDEDFIKHYGKDWVEAKAQECRKKAESARDLAAKLRSGISK